MKQQMWRRRKQREEDRARRKNSQHHLGSPYPTANQQYEPSSTRSYTNKQRDGGPHPTERNSTRTLTPRCPRENTSNSQVTCQESTLVSSLSYVQNISPSMPTYTVLRKLTRPSAQLADERTKQFITSWLNAQQTTKHDATYCKQHISHSWIQQHCYRQRRYSPTSSAM